MQCGRRVSALPRHGEISARKGHGAAPQSGKAIVLGARGGTVHACRARRHCSGATGIASTFADLFGLAATETRPAPGKTAGRCRCEGHHAPGRLRSTSTAIPVFRPPSTCRTSPPRAGRAVCGEARVSSHLAGDPRCGDVGSKGASRFADLRRQSMP